MISVVIPVYKAEKTLSICIESVLKQTFVDIELILVDDGSPDLSGDICDQWMKLDSRIRVFHQLNKGVSSARNRGLDAAFGDYVCFVDPDDWVKPNYIQKMYESLLDYDKSGLIIHGFERITPEGEVLTGCKLAKKILYSSDFGRVFAEDNISSLGYSCSKLYKRDLLMTYNIRFNEQVSCCEDLLFMYHYMLYCDYISFGDSQEYVYIKYPSSLSVVINGFDSEYTCFLYYRNYIDVFAKKYTLSTSSLESTYQSLMMVFRKALKADYQLDRNVSRRVRIEHLTQMILDNKSLICLHYRPAYKTDKVGKFLLMRHFWNCYDCWIKLLFKFRVKAMYLGPR